MTGAAGKPASTAHWDGGQLRNLAGLINVQVGVWNHLKYPGEEPPLGQRDSEAIRAAHGAIDAIDEMFRGLYAIRGQLIDELREDGDVRAARVDAQLAESRAARAAGPGSAGA